MDLKGFDPGIFKCNFCVDFKSGISWLKLPKKTENSVRIPAILFFPQSLRIRTVSHLRTRFLTYGGLNVNLLPLGPCRHLKVHNRVAFPITAGGITYLAQKETWRRRILTWKVSGRKRSCPGIAWRYGIKPRKHQDGRFVVRNSIRASTE